MLRGRHWFIPCVQVEKTKGRSGMPVTRKGYGGRGGVSGGSTSGGGLVEKGSRSW